MQQFAADRIQFILDGAVHLESFHLQTQTAQYGRIDALFQMNFLAGQTAQFRGQLGLLCGIERNLSVGAPISVRYLGFSAKACRRTAI